MTAYGGTHLVMLAVAVLGVVPAVLLGRARRTHGAGDPVGRALGALVGGIGLTMLVVDVTTDFDKGVSLPLTVVALRLSRFGSRSICCSVCETPSRKVKAPSPPSEGDLVESSR